MVPALTVPEVFLGNPVPVTVTEVPGDHDSMVLEPNVRVLAARMARTLAAADAASRLSQAAE